MICLFIGGSAAGKMIDVDIRRSWVAMPGPIGAPSCLGSFDGAQVSNMAIEHEIYEFDVATDRAGNRHIIYVLKDSGCPLAQLMEFYAKADHRPL